MNCPNCGASVNPNGKFCGTCGFNFANAASSGFQPSSNAANNAGNNFPPPPPNSGRDYQPPPPNANGRTAFNFDTDGRGNGRGYTWEVQHGGAFALAVVKLQPEQSIAAEAGAMVAMSGNVELQSEMKGGLFGAMKRMVGGESAFVSTFTARGQNGEVALAPGAPGDIFGIEMNNQQFLVQSSSYLAGDVSLKIDTQFGGSRSFFSGEGLFVLSVAGSGLLLVSSFGSIHRKVLQPGERYIVDTGHLVAWEAQMPYQLRKAAKSWFRSFLSGEGLTAEFIGPGEILIQTRNLAAFAGLLKPFFPTQSNAGAGSNVIGELFGN